LGQPAHLRVKQLPHILISDFTSRRIARRVTIAATGVCLGGGCCRRRPAAAAAARRLSRARARVGPWRRRIRPRLASHAVVAAVATAAADRPADSRDAVVTAAEFASAAAAAYLSVIASVLVVAAAVAAAPTAADATTRRAVVGGGVGRCRLHRMAARWQWYRAAAAAVAHCRHGGGGGCEG
jgi:hypothetical protein